jgi:hypothetical protein
VKNCEQLSTWNNVNCSHSSDFEEHCNLGNDAVQSGYVSVFQRSFLPPSSRNCKEIRLTNHATPLYPQKLALTSTSGGRSVGIVRSRTKATELVVRYVGR